MKEKCWDLGRSEAVKTGTLFIFSFYFLRLLLERKIQGRVFEVFFLKEKELFSEKFRDEIACERIAPAPAAGPVVTVGVPADARAEQCCFRMENKCSDLSCSSFSNIRAVVPPHLFLILPLVC